ncbi:chloride channel protein [Solitalea sp. MAHUQ-68]|uniref:Chloride channel protein n=1 Tax=Solitalea agri TaxID=2953739 RepID=A0A9X2JBZ3_9SPHI|nr:chloride channel protein [Solitalea agri]MCO4292508.1 chloride channel protein [Solitalea agri]
MFTIKWVRKPIFWLKQKLSRNQFLIFSGIIVGLTAGMASVILKTLVHYLHLSYTIDLPYNSDRILVYFLPLIGLVLCVFITRYFFKGRDGRGLVNILNDIAVRSSLVERTKMYSQIFTSSVTVGLGGSAGLESPIAVTGSAIGSNYGRVYGLNYKDRTLLLAAGAAAGIAGAFNAPVTGIMFAAEVLLAGIGITEFIPLIIASVCGALCTKIIFNENILFQFKSLQVFNYWNVPFYLVLGVFCGLLSIYYASMTEKVEHALSKLNSMPYGKAVVGGLILIGLYFLFPPLMGEGYESIKKLADGDAANVFASSWLGTKFSPSVWIITLFIGVVGLIKVFATSVTIGSGGNGGNFAPSLFVGAYVGYFFSTFFNLLGFDRQLPVSNFTLVGMAGILSGVMYAPLTGIFLIAEVTGGYDLIIPLMIVSVSAYLIARTVHKFSMDTRKLAEKGEIFTDDRDKNLLSAIKMAEFIDNSQQTLKPTDNLAELIRLYRTDKQDRFAVVNEENHLLGIVTFDMVRDEVFNIDDQENVLIGDRMSKPLAIIHINESLHKIMSTFDATKSWYLPVVEDGVFKGFISKSAILNSYRKQLIVHSGY